MAKTEDRAEIAFELEVSYDDGLCIGCGAPERYCYCESWWMYYPDSFVPHAWHEVAKAAAMINPEIIRELAKLTDDQLDQLEELWRGDPWAFTERSVSCISRRSG